MQAFGMSAARIEEAGGKWTAREIAQQPAVWRAIAQQPGDGGLDRFLAALLADPALRIVLTGAGSSAFVGECLAPALTRLLRRPVDAVSTTDLVAGPASWLVAGRPTLLVSFARSGNSPESVAALELAQQRVDDCHHLVITCNAQGALHGIAAGRDNARVLLLPPQCNDNSFAMTSSFSSMLLAGALAFGAISPAAVAAAATAAQRVLDAGLPLLQELVESGYERVIYLGANELKGLAREASLKLLELTDGRIVSIADTPLGFRHGPKTVVNARTMVVVLLSGDAHTRRYDLDLLHELRRDGVAGRVLALAVGTGAGPAHPDTHVLPPLADAAGGSLAHALAYVVFAQSYGLLQSLALGIAPDNPNPAGMVNRVVKGVSIYPYEPAG